MRYARHIDRKIRIFVEHELLHYGRNKALLSAIRESMMPSVTAGLSGGTSGGGTTSTTENSALRLVSDARIEHLEKSISAIDRALAKSSVDMRRLIRLVYIINSHSITMAGYEIHVGATNAYSMINDFIILVALEMGIVDEY